ncbi:MAG: HAD family phosphatase [Calditrichaeota bacterium]|nr:HAD family phosphatase [Calditrichota bacterium]
MIRYVIFDLGNVLIHIHPHEVIAEFTRRCNLPTEKIQRFYLSELHMNFMEGKHNGKEFYSLMMDTFPCDLSNSEFINIWNRVIGEPKDGIDQLVQELKSEYTLCICSNTDIWHWQKVLKTVDFIRDFTHYFLSFELKYGKPNPVVYKHVLDTLSAAGDECVFIDDIAENIEAAQEFGIQGIVAEDPLEIRKKLSEIRIIR